MIILLILFFISYYISCITVQNRKVNYVALFIFILFSVFVRFFTPLIENADYNTYLRFVDTGELSELSVGSLFSEPYFFIIVLSLKNFVQDTAASLNLYYVINFIITTIFFIWIIRLRDIQTFSKILLFSLYYFLFAYTTIRNSPAYILVGVLYYFLHRKKVFRLGYLSFLAHLSSVPAVIFSFFRADQVSKKVLIGAIVMFPLFFVFINLPFLNLSDKLSQYEDSTEYGVSTFHKIYFVVIVLLSIFLYFKNKALVFNNVYILNFVMYLMLYSISGVMAFRYSIYFIMFLLFVPVTKKIRHLKLYSSLSLLTIIYFIYSYIANHPNINIF
jgi:hypothetical protein